MKEYPTFGPLERAEVFRMMNQISNLFKEFADGDSECIKDDPNAIGNQWLKGRASAYNLCSEHVRKLGESYKPIVVKQERHSER